MKASTRRQAKFAAVSFIHRTESHESQCAAAKNAVEAFDLFLQQGKGLPIVLHQHPTKGWVLSSHAVSGNVPWWMAFAWRDVAQEEAVIQAKVDVWQDIFKDDPRPSVREAVKTLCELSKGDDIKLLGEISNTKALNAAVHELKLALNSALPVTSPFQVGSTTTHCRMRREVVNGDNLPDLMDLMEQECKRPGTVTPGLAENLDLRRLSFREVEGLVKLAARANVSLQGCGITKKTAARLARRLELHCKSHPADAEAVKVIVGQLCVVKRARHVQLAVQGSSKPMPKANRETLSVGFKECLTSKPIPPGEELVISTECLKTCTAIAVVTRFEDGSRVVTLAHMTNSDMYGAVDAAVKQHHSPHRKVLDHEFFVVTPGLELPELNNEFGIYKNDIRQKFKMGTFTAPEIGKPASTDKVGPNWFHHMKTTLLPYPRNQNYTNGGASFTLVVPEDPSSPVEFFLDLSS